MEIIILLKKIKILNIKKFINFLMVYMVYNQIYYILEKFYFILKVNKLINII